jgi:hypothetical protein
MLDTYWTGTPFLVQLFDRGFLFLQHNTPDEALDRLPLLREMPLISESDALQEKACKFGFGDIGMRSPSDPIRRGVVEMSNFGFEEVSDVSDYRVCFRLLQNQIDRQLCHA